MLGDELMGGIVHELHELACFLYDGGAVAPCEDGGEESGYFDVLLFGELMRNTDRVFFYEEGLIVFLYFFIEEGFEVTIL